MTLLSILLLLPFPWVEPAAAAAASGPADDRPRLEEPCVYALPDGGIMITDDPADPHCPAAAPAASEAGGMSHWSPLDPATVDFRVLELMSLARRVARQHRVDHRLVEALVQVESAFEPEARSSKGAMGLMQIMPGVAARYGVEDPYDAWQNLQAGVRHLRGLLIRFDRDVELAVAAYNAGENAVVAHDGVPPYPETREYVRRVLAVYRARLTVDVSR